MTELKLRTDICSYALEDYSETMAYALEDVFINKNNAEILSKEIYSVTMKSVKRNFEEDSKMTLSPKYGDLYQWFIFEDKPLENGSMIAGLKEDAPESIKKLYKEYLLSKEV